MAVAVRCPECRAKLKFDAPPEPDESIECPKCGHAFEPVAAAMAGDLPRKAKSMDDAPRKTKPVDDAPRKAKSNGEAKPRKAEKEPKKKLAADEDTTGKKRKIKKKKSNKKLLTFMIGGAFVILSMIGGLGYFLFSKSSKMREMASCIPADCNIVRGLNTGQIGRIPAYKAEYTKQLANSPIGGVAEVLAKSMSMETDDFLDYALIGKRVGSGDSVVLVFRTKRSISGATLGPALGGVAAPVAGQNAYAFTGGPLAGYALYCPTDRIVVVITPGKGKDDLLQKSAAARANPESSFYGKMNKTGTKAATAQIWTVIRTEGATASYIRDLAPGLKTDFAPLTTQMDKSTMVAYWTSFGAKGVRMGIGLQCDSSESASSVVDFLRNGEMAKGDDATIPNSFTTTYSQSKSKEFKEFLANISYKCTGDCAYFESTVGKERVTSLLNVFASPSLGESAASGSGARGAGGGLTAGPAGP